MIEHRLKTDQAHSKSILSCKKVENETSHNLKEFWKEFCKKLCKKMESYFQSDSVMKMP